MQRLPAKTNDRLRCEVLTKLTPHQGVFGHVNQSIASTHVALAQRYRPWPGALRIGVRRPAASAGQAGLWHEWASPLDHNLTFPIFIHARRGRESELLFYR